MIDISKLLTDNTNIIEIYLINNKKIDTSLYKRKINIYVEDNIINKIRTRFKVTKETTLIYYNKNNLSYVYDLSNDNQIVYLRKLENIQMANNYYGLAFNEMKMQTHSFACTNDIDNKVEYKMQEFKINNRISLIIKNNNVYIYYKHSKDVDIEKTQEIINGIIKKMI